MGIFRGENLCIFCVSWGIYHLPCLAKMLANDKWAEKYIWLVLLARTKNILPSVLSEGKVTFGRAFERGNWAQINLSPLGSNTIFVLILMFFQNPKTRTVWTLTSKTLFRFYGQISRLRTTYWLFWSPTVFKPLSEWKKKELIFSTSQSATIQSISYLEGISFAWLTQFLLL